MNWEKYEKEIEEKLDHEIAKILAKQELSVDEIKFLIEISSSMKIKKMTNLL